MNDQHLMQLNSATIVLLPKSEEASQPKDFRPISLIHSFAKLATKVMAIRLQPFMQQLVSSYQSAFIRGHCIHDNFIFVQSAIRKLHHDNHATLMLKLDISKAFDSVSWTFLLKLLLHLGFPSRWIQWTAMLLRNSTSRILVNQSLSERISHRRGLRQGDPLSPLLFVFIMDCLARLLTLAEESALLLPIGRRSRLARISLYADDAMIFLNPSPQDQEVIR